MAHQQESFLPFSSRQSLSCCLSRVAKRSTPKPHGPLASPPKPHGPPSSPSKLHASLLLRNHVVSFSMAAMPRFKSQCQSSSAAPFLTPPTISYTCQHSLFFQLYWAAIVSPGRCGPMAWSQSSPSSHTGLCNQWELLPSYVLGGSHSHPPGSKQGHSYLTYP